MTQHAAEVGCCDSSAGAFAPCLADCLHVPIWMCQNARAFALIGPMPSIRCHQSPICVPTVPMPCKTLYFTSYRVLACVWYHYYSVQWKIDNLSGGP